MVSDVSAMGGRPLPNLLARPADLDGALLPSSCAGVRSTEPAAEDDWFDLANLGREAEPRPRHDGSAASQHGMIERSVAATPHAAVWRQPEPAGVKRKSLTVCQRSMGRGRWPLWADKRRAVRG
jgi:hypothetical protein